ncbi:MAG: LIC_12616 family protein [Clostridia bacterium]
MVDLDDFLDSLYQEIKDYTEIPQLLLGEEDIPPEHLVYPRGKMNFIIKSSPQPRHTIIQSRKVIESEEEDFEDDIEYSYLLQPDATLSINFYGKNVSEYVDRARQWFMIDKLGRDYLYENNDCVIKEITDTTNRKTFIETEYEDRLGFDVILGFSEIVRVTERTIETIEMSLNEDEFEIET